MMKRIILTTTASFFTTVEKTELKDNFSNHGIKVVLCHDFKQPFSFSNEYVFAIVAGHTHKGQMLHVGLQEAALFPNLKVVTPFGIGMDHIDTGSLESSGIEVKTLPHLSKRTVAELAIAFMFALARRLAQQTRAICDGEWERQDGVNLFRKTLGIIGLGNIGKEVAKIGKGIGMHVIANDVVYDESFMRTWNIEKHKRESVVRASNFLTLHVPLTDSTNGFIDRAAIMTMRPGSFLINTARGKVVDESAVLEALETGHLAGAAFDVLSSEPPFANETLSRLVRHPNVIVTPHVGAYTPETRYKIAKYLCNLLVPYAGVFFNTCDKLNSILPTRIDTATMLKSGKDEIGEKK